ncbi:hypothetical protein [Nioella ostreopsis]|uniref:hypothetical protein n=1 Tax=Nioella ostreopsis TaxID=2448479 RepID=UPI000FDC6674|nr:hypothetical protein [Nioella ostreopsis]
MFEPRGDPKWLLWNFIEPISNSNLSKLIAAIPVIGYLILFNDTIIANIEFSFLSGSRNVEVSDFVLPAKTKLQLVFLGSVLILVSNSLFRVFQPSALRNAKDEFSFANHVISSYTIAELFSMEQSVFDRDWTPRTLFLSAQRKNIERGYPHTLRSGYYSTKEELFRKEDEDLFREIAYEWFLNEMNTYQKTRVVTLVFSVLGFLLIFIPSLDVFQAVVRDIFEDFIELL